MILVTGAKGFIATHLIQALPKGIDIGGAEKPGDVFLDVDWWLKTQPDRIEAVFHLGAISDTTCNDWNALNATNFVLPKKLGRFCKDRRIPFIYASSASVYGNGEGPLNAYAASKTLFDMWAETYLAPDWYGCRFFNVYGPGEAHKGKQASLVHQIIETQKDGERPRLFLAEEMRRDFIHVDDVVDVMLWMWKTRPPSGIYDVGTGESVTISKLHCEIERALNISHDYKEIEVPAHLVGKLQMDTCADLRKLRTAGYDRPFTPLRDGIRKMLQR